MDAGRVVSSAGPDDATARTASRLQITIMPPPVAIPTQRAYYLASSFER